MTLVVRGSTYSEGSMAAGCSAARRFSSRYFCRAQLATTVYSQVLKRLRPSKVDIRRATWSSTSCAASSASSRHGRKRPQRRTTSGRTSVSSRSRATGSPAAALRARSSVSAASCTAGPPSSGSQTRHDSRMHSLGRIGRYRLERRLGTGAFGTVWLAHDDQLEAPVAVKVLAENWSHRLDVRDRFLSEARLLRRADSNRVVQVYDIGELPDGRPYFVMEYADDGTLADRLAGGAIPVPEALRLTALAARSAAALHEAGIVHRDVKPSNVLLRTAPDGTRRVLLADLGLAKSLAQASG